MIESYLKAGKIVSDIRDEASKLITDGAFSMEDDLALNVELDKWIDDDQFFNSKDILCRICQMKAQPQFSIPTFSQISNL